MTVTTRVLPFILTGLLLLACSGEGPPGEMQEQKVPVTVARVESEQVTVTRDYAGRVRGAREVEVRARVEGILQERLYREGELVSAGDTLFRIDPQPFEARLEEAEAQLQSARADLAAAEREWDRVSRLHEQDAISSRDFDSARYTLALAQSAKAMARARRTQASLDLEYTRVTAPVAGVTSLEAVPEGSLIERGTLLTTLVQLDPVHVRFALPEDDAGIQRAARRALRDGDADAHRREATLLMPDGSEYAEAGEIDFTASTIDYRTGTVSSRAVFRNPEGVLIPGQFVRVRVVLETLDEVFRVPETVISEGAEGPQLFVVNEDGKAEVRQVHPGPVVEGRQVILEGLQDGDRVVINGHASLQEGAPVEVTEPNGESS